MGKWMARVYHMNDEVMEARSTILARLGDVLKEQGGSDTRSLHTGPMFPPMHIITFTLPDAVSEGALRTMSRNTFPYGVEVSFSPWL